MLLEADLPSDPQGLRDMLAATMAELAARRVAGKETQAQIDDLRADRAAARAEIVRLNAVNDHAEAELARLHDIIAALRRHRFGARCEKLDDEQLALAFEDTETALAVVAASLDAVAVTPREPRRRKTNRGRLPAHLERVEQIVDIDNKACGCCGGALHVIGEDVAERLAVVPAIEIVKRSDTRCFVVLPRRWVVERTIAWLNRCRPLAKDWEASIASSETWLIIASIRRMTRRIAKLELRVGL